MTTAVAAPAEEPRTDDCNHLPVRAMRLNNPADDMCGRECVQEFTITVAGVDVKMHRCKEHRIPEDRLGLLRT